MESLQHPEPDCEVAEGDRNLGQFLAAEPLQHLESGLAEDEM